MTKTMVTRYSHETWRQAVMRIASKHLLEAECVAWFDQLVANHVPEDEAAYTALKDWGIEFPEEISGP